MNTRTKKDSHPFGWLPFFVAKQASNDLRVMSPVSVARWVAHPSAAGGGRSEGASECAAALFRAAGGRRSGT